VALALSFYEGIVSRYSIVGAQYICSIMSTGILDRSATARHVGPFRDESRCGRCSRQLNSHNLCGPRNVNYTYRTLDIGGVGVRQLIENLFVVCEDRRIQVNLVAPCVAGSQQMVQLVGDIPVSDLRETLGILSCRDCRVV
jgi:hypothetical protein